MKKALTRRQFTKAAAASSVFSLIPGRVIGANEKVNVAFIGCGVQALSQVRRGVGDRGDEVALDVFAELLERLDRAPATDADHLVVGVEHQGAAALADVSLEASAVRIQFSG